MKLLVDHNLPARLASALNEIFAPEHEIIALSRKFGRHNLKDEEWIPVLGGEGGWTVLSADLNIAKKRPSRELFIRAGLIGFFFSPAMQRWPLHRQAARVLMIWPQMLSQVSTNATGVFEMPASGTKFRPIGR